MPLAPAQPASRRRGNFERIARAPIPLHSAAEETEKHRAWDRRPASGRSAVDFAFASGARAPVRFLHRRLRGAAALVLAACPQDDSRVQGAITCPISVRERAPRRPPPLPARPP